jgi:hypothetical protein
MLMRFVLPSLRSYTKTSGCPFLSPLMARFEALDVNAVYLPVWDSEGASEERLASVPVERMLANSGDVLLRLNTNTSETSLRSAPIRLVDLDVKPT